MTKINMQSGQLVMGAGKPVRVKHDLITQNSFRRVVRRAENRGMVVNSKKTNIICVSDAIITVPPGFRGPEAGIGRKNEDSWIPYGWEAVLPCSCGRSPGKDVGDDVGPPPLEAQRLQNGRTCAGL